MVAAELKVSAPGRLCLLGEHQDYFGLSIIAAAIDLRISVNGKPIPERRILLDLPDIGEREDFSMDGIIPYASDRDYLRSAVNILGREGLAFPSGWKGRVHGEIPINSGTSSSSALVVAWIRFLLDAAGDPRARNPEAVAELAYQAEVAEFEEPGGKMDHYASALGGVVHIQFGDDFRVVRLRNRLGDFVLSDSTVRKDTTGTLGFIKSHVLKGAGRLRKKRPDFNLRTALNEDIKVEIERLPRTESRMLRGTLTTRDLTTAGVRLFRAKTFDHEGFGRLLDRQQDVLRDDLRISIPRIERMIETAREAGALGAKINGSGQGGCILAYAPGNAERVAEALRGLGSPSFVVRVDSGVRSES